MNELIVDVKLWGKDVGALLWDNNNNIASFQYEDKFLRSGLDISPIIMHIIAWPRTAESI